MNGNSIILDSDLNIILDVREVERFLLADSAMGEMPEPGESDFTETSSLVPDEEDVF